MTMMNTSTLTALCLLLLSASTVTAQVSICIGGDCDNASNKDTPAPSVSSAPTQSPVPTLGDPTIVGVARSDPQFSSLLSTVDAVGLTSGLQGEGPFTLFAPNNEALASMNGTAVERWLQQPEVWRPQVLDLLAHHVVEEELLSTELYQQPVGMELFSAQGTPITITSSLPLELDDVAIVAVDSLGSNGVIHTIADSPLLPPSASQDLVELLEQMPFLSTLNRLLKQAGLLETLKGEGPFTILAPTDEAFERVSADTMAMWEEDPNQLMEALLYHVAYGNYVEKDFRMEAPVKRLTNETQPVTAKNILVGDNLANNGVLQIVDRIQMTPDTPSPTPAPAPNSLIGILKGRGEFNMLLDSLEQTERIRDLQVAGRANPLTIFAPRDGSFVTDLPEKFLDETWQTHLINVLTYHIVRGNLLPSNFTAIGQRLPTLNFNSLEVTGLGPVQINEVTIVESIQADNGFIHIVDAMLLPPSATSYVIDLYALFPEFQTLLDRIGISDLTTTLSTEGPMTVFSPVDGAFANLMNPDIYNMEDPEIWKQILMYHIVPGELINFAGLVEEHTPEETLPPREETGLIIDPEDDDMIAAAMANMTNVTEPEIPPPLYTFEVTTLQGSNMTITVQANSIGGANILFEDLLVKNGIVQVIDEVLIPPNVTLPLVTVPPQPAIKPEPEEFEVDHEDQAEMNMTAAVERGGEPRHADDGWFR